MMKRMIWLLLALLCVAIPLSGLAAAADSQSAAMEAAVSLLTEVYGYTDEEARAFTFEVTQDDTRWFVTCSPAEHPGWRYTSSHWKTGGFEEAQSPFVPLSGHQIERYPGESAVRDGLREARARGWFSAWDAQAQSDLLAWMDAWNFRPNTALKAGLADGSLSPAGALQAYFASAYGETIGWSKPIQEWLEAELASYGLTAEKQTLAFSGVRVREDVGLGNELVTLTEFFGETPDELLALSHPKLEGWRLLCGAYRSYAGEGATGVLQSGVVAYQKGDRLWLAVLVRVDTSEPWGVYPVSEQAMPEEGRFLILGGDVRWTYDLCFLLSDTATERFSTLVQSGAEGVDGYLLQLTAYRRSDSRTGEGVAMDRLPAEGQWLHVQTCLPDGSVQEKMISISMPSYLNFWSLADFPRTADACEHYPGISLPGDLGVTAGVHLREKTSSRSRNLGLYNTGVLVRILGTEPGDPYPWVHVRIGGREGYISGLYVDYEGSPCAMKPLLDGPPLPVGVTKREVALKKGTGWLDGTVETLPEGTKLHVLGTLNGWAHVMLPRGELGWLMDVDGTDGYLKADELALYATSLQADWAR